MLCCVLSCCLGYFFLIVVFLTPQIQLHVIVLSFGIGEEAMEEIKKQQEEQGGLAGALGIKLPEEEESDDSDDDVPQTGSQRRAAARAATNQSTGRRPKRPKRGKRG